MRTPRKRNPRGFTLLELMISMAVFMVISGAVLGGMANMQKSYRSSELRTALQQRLRAVMELMAQEIGQAGLQRSTVDGISLDPAQLGNSAPFTLAAVNATGSQSNIAITMNGTQPLFVGEWLQVDGGANQDPIQITAYTVPTPQTTPPTGTITASFGHTHTSGSTPMYPMGVYPDGILYLKSSSSQLALFGDMGTGFYAIEYKCVQTTTTPAVYYKLTRTQWDLNNNNYTYGPQLLIDNLTYCAFSVPAPTDSVQVASGGTTYGMVTQVGFTLTASETTSVLGTATPISVTKSYSNIQPRNIIAADNIYKTACASAGGANCSTFATVNQYLAGELQPDPPAVGNIAW